MQEKYQLPFVSVSGVEWVTLHIKLFTWDYMNFSEIVSLDTPLFHIQDKIMQRHGRSVTGLVIYKDSVRPQNALQDHRATLKELQVPGAETKGAAECTLIYDFKPQSSDCPLLLSSPRPISRHYLLADLDATKLSDLENEVKRGYNLLGHTYNRPQTSTGFRRETANVVPSRPSTAFVR